MATGKQVDVEIVLTDSTSTTGTVTVWNGSSFIPSGSVATKATLDGINFPLEGEAHITLDTGHMYVFGRRNISSETSPYEWVDMGRVTGKSAYEVWESLPENIGQDEKAFLNWLKNGKDLTP